MEHFYVLKGVYEAWAASKGYDLYDSLFEPQLTPDGTGYIVPFSKGAMEQYETLNGLQGSIHIPSHNEFDFMRVNKTVLRETGDENQTFQRNTPKHPLENMISEFTHLYDGTTATMNYNAQGDSEWIFPKTTLPNLARVFKEDNFIKLSRDVFGELQVPDNADNYIYLPDGKVMLYVWNIKSVVENQNSDTISVFLEIPPQQ